jgi:hypothetical protein
VRAAVRLRWASTTEEETALDRVVDDYGILIGLGLLTVLMLGALYGVYRALQGQERTKDIAMLARERGYGFHPETMHGLNVNLPFETFKSGDRRGTSNVLRATIGGVEVYAFDFWWYVEQENRAGYQTGAVLALGDADAAAIETAPPRRQYYSLSCAMAPIDNVLPHLIVTPESRLTRAASSMGVKDLQLESEEFNRTFHVRSQDRDFATKFLDARMQDFMLTTGNRFTFETRGRWLLIASPVLKAREHVELLQVGAAFRKAIPRLIDDLFPPLVPGADL